MLCKFFSRPLSSLFLSCMKKKAVVLLSVALFIVVLQQSCGTNADPNITILQAKVEALEKRLAENEEAEEVEIAPYMARLQRYAQNLYYSGKAENKELASFYIHEMEEIMEELVEFGIYEDGIDISKNMSTFGIGALTGFEGNFAESNFKYFDDRYTSLISSCNACHQATGKEVIVLETPALPAPSGQVFTKP